MTSTAALLALGMTLSACVAATPERPVEGPVRLGQTAYVSGPRVRPEKVVEDSRCPADARCVWAGRVIVQAAVMTGRGTRRMTLKLGEPQRVADGMLTLESVTPERMTDGAAGPLDYRFRFTFAGGL